LTVYIHAAPVPIQPLDVNLPELRSTFAPESFLPVEPNTPEPFFPVAGAFSPDPYVPEVDFFPDPVIQPEPITFQEDIFQQQPEIEFVNRVAPTTPQPVQLFNHIASPSLTEPEILVHHPVQFQSVNEIPGSSHPISNVEENYDYDSDYESLQVRN